MVHHIAYNTAVILGEFFGVSLHKVNPIVLRMGLYHPRDWFKGLTKLEMLPRWTKECENLIPVGADIDTVIAAEMTVWVVEELNCGWKITTEGFHFENPSEAVYFKLRWVG
jgi:hypothetical protein